MQEIPRSQTDMREAIDPVTHQLMTKKATAGARDVLAGETSVGKDVLGRRSFMPWPASIVVTDTMAIAQACVGAVSDGNPPQLFTIMASGRATFLVGSHVPDEVCPAIVRIVRGDHDRAASAEHVWRTVVAPRVLVVDLPMGEYLRPEIQVVSQGMPCRHLPGDSSDLSTIALAAFLAPAVIWSRDRIFTETGLAASNASDTVHHLTTLAIAESVATDIFITTALTSVVVGRGTVAVICDAVHRRPLAVGVALVTAGLLSCIVPEQTRARLSRSLATLTRAAGRSLLGLAEVVNELQTHRSASLVSLVTYETPGWRRRTALELCATLLARNESPMAVTELWGLLASDISSDQPESPSDLRCALVGNPAFLSVGADQWRLGTPASQYPTQSSPDRGVAGVVAAT